MNVRLFVEYLRRDGWVWLLPFPWFVLFSPWCFFPTGEEIPRIAIVWPLFPMFFLTVTAGPRLILSRPVRALPVSSLGLARTLWVMIVGYPVLVIVGATVLGMFLFSFADLHGIVQWINVLAGPSIWTLAAGFFCFSLRAGSREDERQTRTQRVLLFLGGLVSITWFVGCGFLGLIWHLSPIIGGIGIISAVLLALITYPPPPFAPGTVLPDVSPPEPPQPAPRQVKGCHPLRWHEAMTLNPFVGSICTGFWVAGYGVVYLVPVGHYSEPGAIMLYAAAALWLSLQSPLGLRLFASLPISRQKLAAICITVPVLRVLPVAALSFFLACAQRSHEKVAFGDIVGTHAFILGSVLAITPFLICRTLSLRGLVLTLMTAPFVSLILIFGLGLSYGIRATVLGFALGIAGVVWTWNLLHYSSEPWRKGEESLRTNYAPW